MTRVATWNVGNRANGWVIKGLRDLAENHQVDIIGLQECGDRKKALREFCQRTGWQIYDGGTVPGAPSVPIIWNPKTVKATHTGTRKATPPTHVGSRGAGPSTLKAKVWNRVTFRADGQTFVVINGHLVPSVYLPPRRRLARKQTNTLARMVRIRKATKRPVIAVGDFNMRPSHPLTKPLRKLGMVQRVKDPTHGRRCIDHIWTLGIGGKTYVTPMPSDHNAAVLVIR